MNATEKTPEAPKPGDILVHVEHTRNGQPRAYADSVFEGILTFTQVPADGGAPVLYDGLTMEQVRDQYSRRIANWAEKPDWFDVKLYGVFKKSPGVWEVKCTQAYND
jgi:hypothetical protein